MRAFPSKLWPFGYLGTLTIAHQQTLPFAKHEESFGDRSKPIIKITLIITPYFGEQSSIHQLLGYLRVPGWLVAVGSKSPNWRLPSGHEKWHIDIEVYLLIAWQFSMAMLNKQMVVVRQLLPLCHYYVSLVIPPIRSFLERWKRQRPALGFPCGRSSVEFHVQWMAANRRWLLRLPIPLCGEVHPDFRVWYVSDVHPRHHYCLHQETQFED